MQNWKKRRLAKWGLIVIGVIFAVIIFLALGSAVRADTRKEVSLHLQGDTLVVKEVYEREVERIPNVPKGLGMEEAYRLYKGEGKKGEAVIADPVGKTTLSFGFFSVHETTVLTDSVVRYQKGQWVFTSVPRVVRDSSFGLVNFFLLWLPSLCIVVISISNAVLGTTRKEILPLVLFYVTILGIASGTANSFPIAASWLLVGGLFVGAASGILATMSPVGSLGIFASLCSLLTVSVGLEDKNQYLILLLEIEVISFVIAQIIGSWWRRVEKASEAAHAAVMP